MTDVAQALRDPSKIYHEPNDVVQDKSINQKDKIRILRQWEYDVREMQVAEEENMPPLVYANHENILTQVKTALHQLGIYDQEGGGAATKQGGK